MRRSVRLRAPNDRSRQQSLQTLERANRFLVPLDRRGEWYRYHHLFGELLRNELERSEPDMVPVLNGRAMAWCIANDLPEDAVVYGHAAGETNTVAGLVDALALAVHYDGRMETLDEWLSWFSEDELAQYPALAVFGAWVRVLTGRPEDAERWLALADGATSTIPLSDGSATIEPWVATLRAHMMPNGVEQALADANLALDQLPPGSIWIAYRAPRSGRRARAARSHRPCEGRPHRSREAGGGSRRRGRGLPGAGTARTPRGQAGSLGRGRATSTRAAQAVVEETGLGDLSSSAIAHVAAARVALHEARQEEARTALTRAHRLRPMLDHGLPWLTVQVGLELTRAHLALAEVAAARTVFSETKRVLDLRPDLGFLVEDAQELAEQLAAAEGPAGAWAMSLTGAELRLLPYLATHLTIPEIGTRLFLSRNTVKTEAVSIYRKLSASSRSEAIERAVEVGLLESSIHMPQANLTQNV